MNLQKIALIESIPRPSGVGVSFFLGVLSKESGVGKPRESESGVGNFEKLSRRRSLESEDFWGERVGRRESEKLGSQESESENL